MKLINRWLKKVKLSKRQEMVIVSLLLTFGLMTTQLMPTAFRFIFLFVLTVLAFLLSALVLREGQSKHKFLSLLALPSLFTLSLGLFYFLLPVRWLTRLPNAILYAIGIYAILLVENIYMVAVGRTIQLLRVAHAVGFLLTLVTLFLLLNTIFALRFLAIINFISVFGVILILSLQSLWSVKLEEVIDREVFTYSLFFSLIVGQGALIISFMPMKPILASLFLTAAFYSLLGLGQQHLRKRLFRKNIIEYARVFVIIFILALLTTSYR